MKEMKTPPLKNNVHIPVRTCVCCRKKFPQSSLYRIVLKENILIPDSTRHLEGRGAYLCPDDACWLQIKRINIWRRAFRVKSNSFNFTKLESFYANNLQSKNFGVSRFGEKEW